MHTKVPFVTPLFRLLSLSADRTLAHPTPATGPCVPIIAHRLPPTHPLLLRPSLLGARSGGRLLHSAPAQPADLGLGMDFCRPAAAAATATPSLGLIPSCAGDRRSSASGRQKYEDWKQTRACTLACFSPPSSSAALNLQRTEASRYGGWLTDL
mmetsp:Transcript_13492/g.20244  ORF Transcript_13492/g.20244 Transcript_13492/m.20244 type:complete len:154 (-) Transcript_13492:34-495(-)